MKTEGEMREKRSCRGGGKKLLCAGGRGKKKKWGTAHGAPSRGVFDVSAGNTSENSDVLPANMSKNYIYIHI